MGVTNSCIFPRFSMAVAKIDSKSSFKLCNCYKVENLTETILETDRISNLKDGYVLGDQLGCVQFGQCLHGTVGSPFYMAPEVLALECSHQFEIPVRSLEWNFRFLGGMLHTDPSVRLIAQQALSN
ncbi:hypothetical protein L1987_53294 [Smallanthus sonchifolius]|uniref:Uncharacterized protein n=1 Tax=Smallanthus sonchifolius TaxID=185202 RepID=A0ACB9EWP8_9ASTR|nr:hypothetical protein L1987_53294 [Smallanthus sonchifolius]